MTRRSLTILLATAACALAACSGSDDQAESDKPAAATASARLHGATDPNPADFPKPRSGQTLQDFANEVGVAGTEVAPATSVFTTGHTRFAFGLFQARKPVYGPTAIYAAKTPDSTDIQGPIPAPADLLVTEPPYRSRQAASEDDPFAAIYEAPAVDFERPGRHAILILTRSKGKLFAAPAQVNVTDRERDPIPGPRDPAPKTETDTIAAAGGIEQVETRIPPDDMHDVNLQDVVGKKPAAVVFATPQLCESRVCGPVVDIAAQLKQKYGDRVAFIHQEVYVDNDPSKGLRAPLRRFNLHSEPWLFTISADGRIAARLEGSFGLKAFERAVQAALARS